VEKLYVNEILPDGEISTVGLFYSRVEAENIVARLRSLPEKRECRYEITDAVPASSRSRDKKIKQP
jgi:hypothetical protein